MGEFDLIERFFKRPGTQSVALGIGDDCALLNLPPEHTLAVSKDLLIAGVHFFEDADPYQLGQKALAVNLSDLAAMAAQPLGGLLGLGLPRACPDWLAAFSAGFLDMATQYHCPLVGGDTTRSDTLCISVTVLGAVRPPWRHRGAAQVGDRVWVSGPLGQASLALQLLQLSRQRTLSPAEQQALTQWRPALETPQPQLALGQALGNWAHAMIDISDGLAQDLHHILQRSQVGAQLHEPRLPLAPVGAWGASLPQASPASRRQAAWHGGEDYQLCFTAPTQHDADIIALTQRLNVSLHCIGDIVPTPPEGGRLRICNDQGQWRTQAPVGYDHFKESV